jgi:hypothetical protein
VQAMRNLFEKFDLTKISRGFHALRRFFVSVVSSRTDQGNEKGGAR